MTEYKSTRCVSVIGLGVETLISGLLKDVPEDATELTVVSYYLFGEDCGVKIKSFETPRGDMKVEYHETTDPNLVGTFMIAYVIAKKPREVVENVLETI